MAYEHKETKAEHKAHEAEVKAEHKAHEAEVKATAKAKADAPKVVDGRTVMDKADYDKQVKALDKAVLDGMSMSANASAAKLELSKNAYAATGKLEAIPAKLPDGTYSVVLEGGHNYATGVGGCYWGGKDGALLQPGDEVDVYMDCGTGMVFRIEGK